MPNSEFHSFVQQRAQHQEAYAAAREQAFQRTQRTTHDTSYYSRVQAALPAQATVDREQIDLLDTCIQFSKGALLGAIVEHQKRVILSVVHYHTTLQTINYIDAARALTTGSMGTQKRTVERAIQNTLNTLIDTYHEATPSACTVQERIATKLDALQDAVNSTGASLAVEHAPLKLYVGSQSHTFLCEAFEAIDQQVFALQRNGVHYRPHYFHCSLPALDMTFHIQNVPVSEQHPKQWSPIECAVTVPARYEHTVRGVLSDLARSYATHLMPSL